MRVIVDEALCQGHGQCQAAAPEAFAVADDGVSRVLVDEVPHDLLAKVKDAVLRCPVEALRLEP